MFRDLKEGLTVSDDWNDDDELDEEDDEELVMNDTEELAFIVATALMIFDEEWDREKGYEYIWKYLVEAETFDMEIFIDVVKLVKTFRKEKKVEVMH